MKNKPDVCTFTKEKVMYKKPEYKKIVFVSDIHAPFHDEKAVKACLSFIKWWKPDTIIFLGDVVDFYAVSHFDKDPQRKLQLQDEIDSAIGILKKFSQLSPKSNKIFLKGNHEHRLQKFLWSKAAELSGLRMMNVPSLLELDRLKIKYEDTGKIIINNTIIKHGNIVRKFASYSAKGEFESCGVSGISGHTHRLGHYYHTHHGGEYTWLECGCLCNMEAEYMEGKVANWQHGFGIGFYKNHGSSRFNVNLIPIVNGKAMWGGYEFY